MRWTESDGVLVGEFIIDDGRLYRRLVQSGRAQILARNLDLRNNPEYLRPMASMGCELSIPEADYHALCARNPDLKSRDAATQTAAWRKFLSSDESDPYRVRRRVSVANRISRTGSNDRMLYRDSIGS